MNRAILITWICMMLSITVMTFMAIIDDLPMTIMWGVLSIIETLVFSWVVLNDVNEVDSE